jgi:glycosyltransferase involved in cell wall biosynthesis
MNGDSSPLSVDIVVNNYNYEQFVLEAVASAYSQSHPHVKVIVVDDGSTDDSRRLIADAYGERAQVVLKENGGQASALNEGFARSKGDIVMFLDADDVLEPSIVSRVVEAFAASPELAKVQFRMNVIDADGRATGATKPPRHLPFPSGDLQRAELAFPFDVYWLPTSGNAFRREALRRIFPIPEDDFPRYGADWYLVHLTTLLGDVISLEDVGAFYRVHGGNGYEPQQARLDLQHIRDTIQLSRTTTRALERLADELGLERPARILSLSDLANRLISVRLETDSHPFAGDRPLPLLLDAIRAARRRFDVSLPMKALFVFWFAAEAAAPPRVAGWLGELFLFPERRRPLNAILRRFRRTARNRSQ